MRLSGRFIGGGCEQEDDVDTWEVGVGLKTLERVGGQYGGTRGISVWIW